MANPKSDGRMIRKDISNSDGFAALSPEAAVLFQMLIPHYNPFGKLNGGSGYIKEIVCPKVTYLTQDNIHDLMQEISVHTNVKYFLHDKRYWIHSLSFLTEHQKIDTKKLGKDELPNYSGTSPELVGDYSGTSPELVGDYSGTSPELVGDQSVASPPSNVNVNVNVNENVKACACEEKEQQDPPLPDDFEPDRITSDTPLPPVVQAEWEKLTELFQDQSGVVKGRNAAIKPFVKSCERWRILRNAGHYAETAYFVRGFRMGLDKFVCGAYRDYDKNTKPLGEGGTIAECGLRIAELNKDADALIEFSDKVKSGEISARPRDRLPFETIEEYEQKKAEGKLPMIGVEL